MGILKVITIEKLQKFYDDLKIKIKNNHYTKTEIDDKLKNVNIDTSSLLDKATYDSDNDGIVDIAKTANSIAYANVIGTPKLSNVAISGDYFDLINAPSYPITPELAIVATTGSYNDLTDKPTIPTKSSELTLDNVYTKNEIDTTVATKGDMTKAVYDTDNDGIVDRAKLIDGMTKNDLDKMIELLTLLHSSNPQQYLGTNFNNELGMYYFPINQETHNSIEQKVALNVKTGDTISIETANPLIEQKAFVQVFEYEEGTNDVISTIKEFNNTNADNFICGDNVTFDNSCHIKNEYDLNSALDETDGYYKSEIINKDNFIEFFKIEEG